MGARVVTVNEVLGGHVKLDIECLDWVCLNAYVPILQSSGQVVAFMTQHLGLLIPSPAIFDNRLPAGDQHGGAAVQPSPRLTGG
jgi:hypothetical protein